MTKLREEDLVCAQVLTAECGRSVRRCGPCGGWKCGRAAKRR